MDSSCFSLVHFIFQALIMVAYKKISSWIYKQGLVSNGSLKNKSLDSVYDLREKASHGQWVILDFCSFLLWFPYYRYN